MTTSSPKKPSLWYLALAPVVLAAGIGLFVWAIVHFALGLANGPIPVDGPGSHNITLDKAGRYTVFQDYPTGQFARFDGSAERPYPSCSVASGDGKRQVPARLSLGSYTYTTGNRSGQSMYEFEIGQPGTYRIDSRHADGSDTPTYRLSVGPTLEPLSLVFTIFGGIAVCFGSFAVAAAIVIIVLVKRAKATPPPPIPIPMTPFPPPSAPPSERGPMPPEPNR